MMPDCVPFALWVSELLLRGEVKRGAIPLKRSRSESESEQGDKSRGVDPKRGDLPMARVKRE